MNTFVITHITINHCHSSIRSTDGEGQLTGLSDAVQILADSSGIDCHHADGIFSVRRQLGKKDSSFLPSDLGLVWRE